MATVKVTDDTFAAEVTNSNIPVVVDFWAEWCGPCKQIGPALEELSDEYEGKVKIVKINVDENPNSPAQMGVRGIPALFLFKNGEAIANKTGAAPKAAMPHSRNLQEVPTRKAVIASTVPQREKDIQQQPAPDTAIVHATMTPGAANCFSQ